MITFLVENVTGFLANLWQSSLKRMFIFRLNCAHRSSRPRSPPALFSRSRQPRSTVGASGLVCSGGEVCRGSARRRPTDGGGFCLPGGGAARWCAGANVHPAEALLRALLGAGASAAEPRTAAPLGGWTIPSVGGRASRRPGAPSLLLWARALPESPA